MTKEQKVNRKDVLPMVQSISELTEKIAEIVSTIPEGYIRTSYETSVKNIRSKNTNFLEHKSGTAVRATTPEEKAAIAAMLAEMRKNAPVPEATGTTDESDEQAVAEEVENTSDAFAEGAQRISKKNRRHN